MLPIQVALAGEPSTCLTALADASARALAHVEAAAQVAADLALSLGQNERIRDLLAQVDAIQQMLPNPARPARAYEAASGWGHAVTALAEALEEGATWLAMLVAAQPETAPARHLGHATEAFLRRHHADLVAHAAEELD